MYVHCTLQLIPIMVLFTLPDDEIDDDELSTGVAVAISIVVTFIITLVVTALISIIITSLYYKHLIDHIKKTTVVQKGTNDAHVLAGDIEMHNLANVTTRTNIAMTNIDPADATPRNNTVAVIETAIRTNITVMEADSAYTLTS